MPRHLSCEQSGSDRKCCMDGKTQHAFCVDGGAEDFPDSRHDQKNSGRIVRIEIAIGVPNEKQVCTGEDDPLVIGIDRFVKTIQSRAKAREQQKKAEELHENIRGKTCARAP